LASLFVERSHPLWKGADVLAWLQTAATAAADVADGKARSSPQQQQQTQPAAGAVATTQPDDVVIEGSAQDWACVARESFPPTERNEYAHLRLSDFSDAVNTLPQVRLGPGSDVVSVSVGCGGGGS
jgi:hypothetical protein